MRYCRRVLALLVSTLIVSAAPAVAQNARLEAARKEGKVVWYTSLALTSSEKVAKLFETAYPGVKVEVHRTGEAAHPAEVEAKGLAIPASNAQQLHYSAPNDAGEIEIRDGRGQVEQAATARLRQAMQQRAQDDQTQGQGQAPAAEAPRGAFGQRAEASDADKGAPGNRAQRRAAGKRK